MPSHPGPGLTGRGEATTYSACLPPSYPDCDFGDSWTLLGRKASFQSVKLGDRAGFLETLGA